MGLFGNKSGKSFDDYVREAQASAEAIILDVRSEDEFAREHIKGAINVPVNRIASIRDVIDNLDVPVYVHCLSGARSSRAVKAMQKMGYTKTVNMGGINSYNGPVESGSIGSSGGAR